MSTTRAAIASNPGAHARAGGPQAPRPPRLFLHATHLEFEHPATHAWMVFDAPLPPDLAAFLADWER
jgi:23S rRNA pseudouridine1911/1915/1917 synthase